MRLVYVDSVMPNMAAAKTGIRKGDRIVAFNGAPVNSWCDFDDQIGVMTDVMTATAKTTKDSLKVRTTTWHQQCCGKGQHQTS